MSTARTRTALAPKWLSRKDAARSYAVSLDTIDELIAAGAVTAKRLDERNGGARRILVSAASLDAWVESLPEA